MAGQGSGLRFDIYERIHLPEGLDGIQELEEAELAPHIQVVEESDYAVIKGNLWLTGEYRGDSGLTGHALEHLIPVEITMPLNRIERLEDVRVEIDQFDVELISNRSLNVTGVLSLHGLEMVSSEETSKWEPQDEEETVFVYDLQPAGEMRLSDYSEDESSHDKLASSYTTEIEESSAIPWDDDADASLGQRAIIDLEELRPVAYPQALEEFSVDSFRQEDEVFYAEAEQQETEDLELYRADEEELPAQQEIKVAITSKTGPEGLSHLHSLVRPIITDDSALEQKEGEDRDPVEWKSLFIRESEQNSFAKMRICIVQKEETIEQIAFRYRINPREIALYNRLLGSEVGEGDILYIPSS